MKHGKKVGFDNTEKNQAGTNSAFTYIADDYGYILETRPTHDLAQDKTLGPWKRPNKPLFIDTPEKKAMWDSYWDNVVGWWDHERTQEFRDRTWR